MSLVKVGLIGVGNMGSSHVQLLDKGQIVELPVDPNDYFEKLQEKISTSAFEKKNVTNTILDVKGTH